MPALLNRIFRADWEYAAVVQERGWIQLIGFGRRVRIHLCARCRDLSCRLFFEYFFHDLKYRLRLIDQLFDHALHLVSGRPVGFKPGFLRFG